jgi:hypothetical protein
VYRERFQLSLRSLGVVTAQAEAALGNEPVLPAGLVVHVVTSQAGHLFVAVHHNVAHIFQNVPIGRAQISDR